jgi:hypothetical protein
MDDGFKQLKVLNSFYLIMELGLAIISFIGTMVKVL